MFLNRDPNNKKGYVIPLRLDHTEPSEILGHFRYYDWIEKSQEEYTELLETLQELTIAKTSMIGHATIARVYDYFLDGSYNTDADRRVAAALRREYPDIKKVMISNRAFLRRAVRYLAERGVRQFIDVGPGLPTQGNTHEIAKTIWRDARVVYVDCDRQVVEASRRLTKDEPNVRVVLGDLKRPHLILRAKGMDIIDFRNPVGLLLVAVIHFILDDSVARKCVQVLRDPLAMGSYVVISHAYKPKELGTVARAAKKLYWQMIDKVHQRQSEEVLRLFEGTTLVEPGLVLAPVWHPEIEDPYLPGSRPPFSREPYRSVLLVGVGVVVSKG